MRKYYIWIVAFIAAFAMPYCIFGGAEEIKERMKNRLSAINELKMKGVVGENNKGFLESRNNSSEGSDVIGEENKDRLIVYAAIAQKTNVTPEIVGQRRAKQIAEVEPKGYWLQDEGGKWYQK